MKRVTLSFVAICCAAALSACSGNASTNIKGDTAQAKVETSPAQTEAPAAAPTAQALSTQVPANQAPETQEQEADKKPANDIWTYYNDATWNEDFKGLKSTIEKVVVTDKGPKDYDENNLTASMVGVKFKIENTTQNVFTTYPDQAVLVTSTGEQIDMPDMFASDNIGGEIEEGVIKEGNVIWELERGKAEEIKWIKLKWTATEGDGFSMDAARKEFEVKLQLK